MYFYPLPMRKYLTPWFWVIHVILASKLISIPFFLRFKSNCLGHSHIDAHGKSLWWNQLEKNLLIHSVSSRLLQLLPGPVMTPDIGKHTLLYPGYKVKDSMFQILSLYLLNARLGLLLKFNVFVPWWMSPHYIWHCSQSILGYGLRQTFAPSQSSGALPLLIFSCYFHAITNQLASFTYIWPLKLISVICLSSQTTCSLTC